MGIYEKKRLSAALENRCLSFIEDVFVLTALIHPKRAKSGIVKNDSAF